MAASGPQLLAVAAARSGPGPVATVYLTNGTTATVYLDDQFEGQWS